jgi:predicted nucleotidyltransferase
MDFVKTLTAIAGFLDERGIHFALVGGLALTAYGSARSTLDVDLAVDAESQDNLIQFMESLGFETLYRSTGYSNHLHSDKAWGRVDFVYVRGETADKVFGEARSLDGPGGLKIPVPKPEHLIAMKVLAMKNDPERMFQEMADIRILMEQPEIDQDEIREYFAKQGLLERYRELEETF